MSFHILRFQMNGKEMTKLGSCHVSDVDFLRRVFGLWRAAVNIRLQMANTLHSRQALLSGLDQEWCMALQGHMELRLPLKKHPQDLVRDNSNSHLLIENKPKLMATFVVVSGKKYSWPHLPENSVSFNQHRLTQASMGVHSVSIWSSDQEKQWLIMALQFVTEHILDFCHVYAENFGLSQYFSQFT